MRLPDPNLPHLQVIAAALCDLRERVVFVGGSTAGLLLSDPLAEGVRPTLDVDAIVPADGLRTSSGSRRNWSSVDSRATSTAR